MRRAVFGQHTSFNEATRFRSMFGVRGQYCVCQAGLSSHQADYFESFGGSRGEVYLSAGTRTSSLNSKKSNRSVLKRTKSLWCDSYFEVFFLFLVLGMGI